MNNNNMNKPAPPTAPPQEVDEDLLKRFLQIKNSFRADEDIEVEHTSCATSEFDIRALDFNVEEKHLEVK